MHSLKLSYSFFVFLVLLSLVNCQSTEVNQSTEEFAQEVIEVLREKNEQAYLDMYLSRTDFKRIFDYSNGEYKFKTVWERYERNLSRAYSRTTNPYTFGNITVDSIVTAEPYKHGMEPWSLINKEKCEQATIHIYFTTVDNRPKYMTLKDCIKRPGTTWKLSKIPYTHFIKNK
ncbi:MAG: hypothetical protein AAF502_07205 [Bacteroidota bacterium]